MPKTQTFFYNAHGSAIGGTITRPVVRSIDTGAATALPPYGGYSSAQHENFAIDNIIRFDKAYTTVAGNYKQADDTYNSLVTVTIEGLNVLDTVTADRIVARISSRYKPGEDETNVVFVGSQYENLRVAGHQIQVEMDGDVFCQHGTLGAFKNRFKQDQTFRRSISKQFMWTDVDEKAPDFIKQRYKWCTPDSLPESKGLVQCSLVKAVHHDCQELQSFGNVLILPQFGVMYLGEVMMKEGGRRLSMMRFDLGSPVDGQVDVGTGEGNGSAYP